MRRLVLAATVAIAASAVGLSAQAMPALQVAPQDGPIVQVVGGCGPNGHRNPYGQCVPNYMRRPIYRACPPGLHLNRFGRCRPNF
jgi:hypothetical protein